MPTAWQFWQICLVVKLLVFSIMYQVASFGVQINWSKTKIQQMSSHATHFLLVKVDCEEMEVVDTFVYLDRLFSLSSGRFSDALLI